MRVVGKMAPAAAKLLREKQKQWERALETQIKQRILAGEWPWGPGEPEFKFMPTRGYRFDRAWEEFRVAVEVDGGTFSGGAHVRGLGIANDHRKAAEAMCLGWVVLRVTSDQVKSQEAVEWLQRLIRLYDTVGYHWQPDDGSGKWMGLTRVNLSSQVR